MFWIDSRGVTLAAVGGLPAVRVKILAYVNMLGRNDLITN